MLNRKAYSVILVSKDLSKRSFEWRFVDEIFPNVDWI